MKRPTGEDEKTEFYKIYKRLNWRKVAPAAEYGKIQMVERTRFELVTSSMPLKRATNCANAPEPDDYYSRNYSYINNSIAKVYIKFTWLRLAHLSFSR